MSTSPLRAIFVGIGGRGKAHLQAFASLPYTQPVALVDIVPEYLESARQMVGLPASACFQKLEDALEAVPADVVVVVTHARMHTPFVALALEAGKHVMVEKPFTCSLAEGEGLVARAEAAGLKIMVTQQVRYLRAERTIRRLLAQEVYGPPGFAHFINYKARGKAYPYSDHMQLWQMSVHELDGLLGVFQRPVRRVCAKSFDPIWGDWPSPSTVSALVEFEGPVYLSYVSTSAARAFGFEFRIECGKGALVQRAARLGRDSSLQLLTTEGATDLALDPGMEAAGVARGMAEMFYRYVMDGEEPEISGRNNLATLRLCDAIARSSEANLPVDL